jgi:thiol:disulfide interchange protein DsbG
MSRLVSSLVALAACVACVPTWAQASASSANPPNALRLAITGGMQVEKQFDGPSGLTGWVLKSNRSAEHTVVYTTADGQTLVVGTLFDAQGQNLSTRDKTLHVPKPDYAKFWQRVESSTWVAEGAQGPAVKAVLYAFLDPNCVYCHMAWTALQAYHRAGVQVRWIPVGFLRADSLGKAAAILESREPAQALREHELNTGPGKSGIAPVTPKPATLARLQSNQALMAEMGISGTPGFVWKDASGQVQVKVGMPRLAEFATMTGVPEQPVTDPDLQRFR